MARDANLQTINKVIALELRWVGAHQGDMFESSKKIKFKIGVWIF
jgi:hypothetical protein